MNNTQTYNIGDHVILFHNKFCHEPIEECKHFTKNEIFESLGEGHYHIELLCGIITKIEKGIENLIVYAKYSNGEEIGVSENNEGLISIIK